MRFLSTLLASCIFLLLTTIINTEALNSVWRWECEQSYCRKKPITPENEETALSLPACQLFCNEKGAIWPKPTGEVTIAHLLAKININSVNVLGTRFESRIHNLVNGAARIFKKKIQTMLPKSSRAATSGGKTLDVNLVIEQEQVASLALETDEAYTLTIKETSDQKLNATITSLNFFGARHGLETLKQLIIFDDLRDEVQLPSDVTIVDKPAYPHRGILLDTSRNYVNTATIKGTLEGMGASKLNSFHWHITDSHSFPFVSKSRPDLSKYGAYSPFKVYSPEDVKEIVDFGLERGVRVIPEFDAPAHVGEGWQNTDLVVCFDKKPWQSYCVEPPCGQLDPTKPGVYDALEDIYGDMVELFKPVIFHMGGDEVNFNCWNSTESITTWMLAQNLGRDESDFIKLWDQFQAQALERLYKKTGKEVPVVLWTSTLTEEKYLDYLPKDKYIIQIWTTGTDPQVTNLLQKGYRVIVSNYDALYFDCGYAGWVQDGNNWCSPYIGWQKVYGNTMAKIAGGADKELVLGAEATLWTEQADSAVIDSRLWPRAAAMAEVLWSEPAENSWRDAESRFLIHRERLVELGIDADAVEPEWCLQNQESCPVQGKFNQ